MLYLQQQAQGLRHGERPPLLGAAAGLHAHLQHVAVGGVGVVRVPWYVPKGQVSLQVGRVVGGVGGIAPHLGAALKKSV